MKILGHLLGISGAFNPDYIMFSYEEVVSIIASGNCRINKDTNILSFSHIRGISNIDYYVHNNRPDLAKYYKE